MKVIKIALALALFCCVLNMPYGYYQFVRFITSVIFSYFAYEAQAEGRKEVMFIYIALAVLFQPILKIALGRELWNVIDIIVGVGLISTVFLNKRSKQLP